MNNYPNVEYIVSEDCSTDDTLEIVHKYDNWLTLLVAEKNGGMSKAINRGWAKTTGDIVTWISSDDVYLPQAFHRVAMAYRQNPAAGEIVGAFRFMNSDSTLASESIPPRLPQGSPIDLTLQEPESWRLHQVSTFYSRRSLEVVGFHVREDFKHNMDREILYRVCRAFPLTLIDEPLACFRTHPNSKSWSVSNMAKMGEEYARVQDLFVSSNPRENARRRRIASHLKAKG